MSIILKALKKAEEQKRKDKKVHIRVFRQEITRSWGILIALLGTSALIFFFVVYLLKSSKSLKPSKPVIQAPVVVNVPTPTLVVNTPVLLLEAQKSLKEKHYEDAEKLLKDAVSKEPLNPSLWNHLGLAFKEQGKFEEAISSYRKALRLKPDYYFAMNNMAVALETQGQLQKAEELYKKALSLNPSYEEAHLNYGLLLEGQGKVAEAKKHFESFLRLSSNEELKRLVQKRLR